jgi:hypothetical protein
MQAADQGQSARAAVSQGVRRNFRVPGGLGFKGREHHHRQQQQQQEVKGLELVSSRYKQQQQQEVGGLELVSSPYKQQQQVLLAPARNLQQLAVVVRFKHVLQLMDRMRQLLMATKRHCRMAKEKLVKQQLHWCGVEKVLGVLGQELWVVLLLGVACGLLHCLL